MWRERLTMATYKLTIEYDGTRFRGWQTHLPACVPPAGRRPDFNRGSGDQSTEVPTLVGTQVDAAYREN